MKLIPSIHLINRHRHALHRVAGTSDVYDSGDWVVSADTAAALIGGNLYLHEGQAERSYYGGTILDWRLKEGAVAPQRIVFRFRHSADHHGVVAGRTGWAQEMKLVDLTRAPHGAS